MTQGTDSTGSVCVVCVCVSVSVIECVCDDVHVSPENFCMQLVQCRRMEWGERLHANLHLTGMLLGHHCLPV